MKKNLAGFVSLLVVLMLASLGGLYAQGKFEVVTGADFDQSVPSQFYLEGKAIPTQKRNAALIRTPAGARVLFALLDTSGYGSDITQKYTGMMITEGKLSICGKSVDIGSYGMGLKTEQGGMTPAAFDLYNQAGEKVLECEPARDESLSQPRPLQVIPQPDGNARLYLGRYWVELK